MDNFLGRRELYEFIWHDFADWYLEISKIEKTKSKSYILNTCYLTLLKLLHP
ncbi:MAG TPA: hypothetical protein ENI16_00705, partial [Candidatus Portnoybacteria bacterium]|nr:hypothetical protein [Candidatus Portnoybacteria bacterium]